MDAETRALLIGLYKTLTKLTVTLVEQGAIDSNRAVRSFRDFTKSLGDEPHDQAARLWVDQLVETLAADRMSVQHLPDAVNRPSFPLEEMVPGRVKYAAVSPTRTAATVTFSSEFPADLRRPGYPKTGDDLTEPMTAGGHILSTPRC